VRDARNEWALTAVTILFAGAAFLFFPGFAGNEGRPIGCDQDRMTAA
jgi:hypothetical protein